MKRAEFKKWERVIAEELGGKRVPVTGRHSGDVPDIDHPDLAIEVKATGRQVTSTMSKAMEQAQLAGKATGKTPAVVHVFTGGQGRSAEKYITFTVDDYVALMDRAFRVGLEQWQ